MHRSSVSRRYHLLLFLPALMLAAVGCGTTRSYTATEQLVMSDAVDRSIGQLDFRPLSGSKVYLDTSYLRHVKGEGFVNAEYVTSALRQQIVAAGCLIQDANTEAEIIIEARIGTLGQDDHRVTFGVPETNMLASAAALIPGAPTIPRTGELAFARREAREAAVKVAAFAYDRETRAPVWQSGVDSSVATATDTWVMGIGPFQGGSARGQTKLAGSALKFGKTSDTGSSEKFFERPSVDYMVEMRFEDGDPILDDGGMSNDMLGVRPEEIAMLLERYSADVQLAAAESELEEVEAEEDSAASTGDSGTPGKSDESSPKLAAIENVVDSEKIEASDAQAVTKPSKEAAVGAKVVEVKNGHEVAKDPDVENKKNLK